MKNYIKKIASNLLMKIFPEIRILKNSSISWNEISNVKHNSLLGDNVFLSDRYSIQESEIGSFTSISANSRISLTTIGKYCSIGPNFISGWGIHPTDGISTCPIFYSTQHSTGKTYSETKKIDERKRINIGNDVWIGSNCVILDGVSIGNGCIIAAGAVVTKDVSDYAIVGGVPAKIIKYRFNDEIIRELQKIKWWDFEGDNLKDVEKYFFNVNEFVKKYKSDDAK